MTLKQLQALVTRTEEKTPTHKKLRESGIPVIMKTHIENSIVTVYENGFTSYSKTINSKVHTTVFAVDMINWSYSFVDGQTFTVPKSEYENLDAATVLAMKGEERLAHNTESREEYKVSFHLENDGTDYAKEAAAPDFTDAFLNKMESEIQSEQLRNALSKLTQKQYIVVKMYFFDGMTQEEIAVRLGIERSSVSSRLQGALKKLKKVF